MNQQEQQEEFDKLQAIIDDEPIKVEEYTETNMIVNASFISGSKIRKLMEEFSVFYDGRENGLVVSSRY